MNTLDNHVLVTGSAGRIGRAAVNGLLARGIPVFGFDRVATPGLAADRYAIGTLEDLDSLHRAAKGARCIIHLAATPDDAKFPRGTSPDDGDNFLDELVPNNVVGSYRIMEAARKFGVPRVILASTGQLTDGLLRSGRVPISPSSPVEPRYLYACTKVFLEALGQVYSKQHGIEVMGVRLGWCPRPGQNEEFRQSGFGPDVYLSPGDAGRFFASAAEAKTLPKFSVVYVASQPVNREVFDMSETTRLTGYVPKDRWDGSDPSV